MRLERGLEFERAIMTATVAVRKSRRAVTVNDISRMLPDDPHKTLNRRYVAAVAQIEGRCRDMRGCAKLVRKFVAAACKQHLCAARLKTPPPVRPYVDLLPPLPFDDETKSTRG